MVTNSSQELGLCKDRQAARLVLQGFADYPSRLLCKNKPLLRPGQFWKVHRILATKRRSPGGKERKKERKKKEKSDKHRLFQAACPRTCHSHENMELAGERHQCADKQQLPQSTPGPWEHRDLLFSALHGVLREPLRAHLATSSTRACASPSPRGSLCTRPNLFPLSVLIQTTWSRNSQQGEGNELFWRMIIRLNTALLRRLSTVPREQLWGESWVLCFERTKLAEQRSLDKQQLPPELA